MTDVLSNQSSSIHLQCGGSSTGSHGERTSDLFNAPSDSIAYMRRRRHSERSQRAREYAAMLTILDPIFQQKLRALFRRLPPRCNTTPRWLSCELGDLFIRLVENCMLLLESHVGGIFVGISMKAAGLRLEHERLANSWC